MELDNLVEKTAAEFKADPRTQVEVSHEILVAAAKEELGRALSSDEINKIIESYVNGDLESEEEYDAIVYGCAEVARACFAEDPEDEDEDVDYEIDWSQEDGGNYFAWVSEC